MMRGIINKSNNGIKDANTGNPYVYVYVSMYVHVYLHMHTYMNVLICIYKFIYMMRGIINKSNNGIKDANTGIFIYYSNVFIKLTMIYMYSY
jgi:hypothetical protein